MWNGIVKVRFEGDRGEGDSVDKRSMIEDGEALSARVSMSIGSASETVTS